MNIRSHWYAGIAGVIIYIGTVVFGGMIYPGYSHIAYDISQLTSTLSPVSTVMNPLFFLYNLLVSLFGVGLYKESKNIWSKVAAGFIVTIGLLGATVLLFPINTRGTEVTLTGVVHISLVSVISLFTVIANVLFWRSNKYNDVFISRVSLITGCAFLISGPLAALYVMSPYAGLFERIPIGIFLTWIVLISTYELRKAK